MSELTKRNPNAAGEGNERVGVAWDCGADGRFWILGLLVVFGFLAWALCRNIGVPWVEDDNWYGAVYSQAAHNNLRAGILSTAGVPVTLYFGELPFPQEEYYVHHPTLLPTLVTAAFALFGESEWAARLVPIGSSLVSVILLWLLVRSAVNTRAATLTAAVFATLPMELHYGDMVDFEPCLLMWMLAVLLCLRYWHVTGSVRWAWLAAVASLVALWMDWPGYLFVLSLAGYFFVKWWRGAAFGPHIPPAVSLRFSVVLVGLVGAAGIGFLLQIRYVRPDAWLDLWRAATMRLSNSTATDAGVSALNPVHFSMGEWCRAILRGLSDNFLLPPWLFAAVGLGFLWANRRKSDGLRWCGFAMMPMTFAGVLYVVILRNESYVHDFATFYLIAALAMAGGIGLECVIGQLERRFPGRALQAVTGLAAVGMFAWLGVHAVARAEEQRSQFYVLDAEKAEPPDFIPSLGRFLGKEFPRGTDILCNFAASGTLDYYAQRNVLNGIVRPEDWKAFAASRRSAVGGILWLDAPQAEEVLASFHSTEWKRITFAGYRFALWQPGRPKGAAVP